MRVFRSSLFWIPFAIILVVVGVFFAWELDQLSFLLPSFPRPAATQMDIIFTIVLGLLLAFNAGLATWSMKMGSCPVGTKRATGIAGVIGAVTLLCPVCLVLPASLFGLGIVLTFLAPFLPLLRLIALLLLIVTTWMMWPKREG